MSFLQERPYTYMQLCVTHLYKVNSRWNFLIQDPGAVYVHQFVHDFKLNMVLAN